MYLEYYASFYYICSCNCGGIFFGFFFFGGSGGRSSGSSISGPRAELIFSVIDLMISWEKTFPSGLFILPLPYGLAVMVPDLFLILSNAWVKLHYLLNLVLPLVDDMTNCSRSWKKLNLLESFFLSATEM